jgi:hypothetical protein
MIVVSRCEPIRARRVASHCYHVLLIASKHLGEVECFSLGFRRAADLRHVRGETLLTNNIMCLVQILLIVPAGTHLSN